MKVIAKTRQSGKTNYLIELSAKENITIVCFNYATRKFIKTMAESKGLKIPEPITYSEFFNFEYDQEKTKKVCFDDLDSFLQSKTICDIECITLSLDDEEEI